MASITIVSILLNHNPTVVELGGVVSNVILQSLCAQKLWYKLHCASLTV